MGIAVSLILLMFIPAIHSTSGHNKVIVANPLAFSGVDFGAAICLGFVAMIAMGMFLVNVMGFILSAAATIYLNLECYGKLALGLNAVPMALYFGIYLLVTQCNLL